MTGKSKVALICLTGSICLSVFTSYSQDLSEKYDKYIDTLDLRRHLTVLASDSLQGRKSGEAGQYLAAAYLQQTFKNLNLSFVPGQSGYEQSFPLVRKLYPEFQPQTSNIIAYVAGSDEVLKNEIIVISAHYDHLGVRDGKVYNGADDNGSGTSALLEIAEAFQKAAENGEQPKRSYIFLGLTAEEMGLLGSEYYVKHEWIPLAQTVADLNIDMIGRVTDSILEKDHYQVSIIGSNLMSDDLHDAHEEAHQKYSTLLLDYTYNALDHPTKLYFRSDHYNFAKNGIPSIFYFGGFHEDYHEETDEIATINFEKIRQVSTLVFHTAWILGNAPERPAVRED